MSHLRGNFLKAFFELYFLKKILEIVFSEEGSFSNTFFEGATLKIF